MSLRDQQYRSLLQTHKFLCLIMSTECPTRKRDLRDIASRCLWHFPPLLKTGQPLWSRDDFDYPDEEKIVVDVHGGIASCNHPLVEIRDHDNFDGYVEVYPDVKDEVPDFPTLHKEFKELDKELREAKNAMDKELEHEDNGSRCDEEGGTVGPVV